MKRIVLFGFLLTALISCKKDNAVITEPEFFVNEDAATFAETASFDVGETGAAEITAFDPITKKLFVVRNENEGLTNQVNQIEVIDFSNPSAMKSIGSITMRPFGGAVNGVVVYEGKLAAAIQSTDKQANGKVVVFKTSDYSKIAEVIVGALPDMVTFTPNGKYILSANEGEPNAAYTNDPSGTVSIISVADNYSVVTIDFSSMASQQADLKSKGFRIFGKDASFVKDVEPEYITISEDSKTAWVTLQENNAIAKINIESKSITNIFPLGFKDYSLAGNEIDPSDLDGGIKPAKWNVKGMYLPDAITLLEENGTPYLFTANEGDAREYDGFSEILRVKNKDIKLDATAFPDAVTLKLDANLGRLNVTTTLGDKDGDGDLDELYSLGSRSFSVWNGNTGGQVFDSKNELDKLCFTAGVYDDNRSDDIF